MSERRMAVSGRGRGPLNWRDENGKSSIRGLLALLVIVGVVYGGMKFLPVRASAYQFNDALRDEVVFAGSRRSTDDQIMTNLLEEAVFLELPITREDIKITRSGRKWIVVEANYTVNVELIGGYTFPWTFNQRYESPIF